MKLRQLHPWDVTPAEAMAIQEQLRAQVSPRWDGRHIEFVGGADVGIARGGDVASVAFVVLTYPDLHPVEQRTALVPIAFPYIPGLLSFREVPVLAKVIAQVEHEPQVILVDGQGIAHPRRLGLAAHLGVLLDLPTIGCAKSRLVGHHAEPPAEPCSATPLLDDHEQIGAVVRTKRRSKPLFVSIGHRITLDTAVEIVCNCCRGHRLPEPTRLAHLAATALRRTI